MKGAYTAFGPIGVGAGRVLGGAGVLWVVWALSKKQGRGGVRGLSGGDWLALMVPVVLGSIYPYIMQPYLIGKHQDSAFFGLMVCLVPLLTILVSVPLLRVLPTVRETAGVLLGLLCMGLLLREGGVRGIMGWDLVLAALVPMSYAISNTFIKRRLSGMQPLFMTAMILGLTSIVITPIGAAVEGGKPVTDAQLWRALGVLAWQLVVRAAVPRRQAGGDAARRPRHRHVHRCVPDDRRQPHPDAVDHGLRRPLPADPDARPAVRRDGDVCHPHRRDGLGLGGQRNDHGRPACRAGRCVCRGRAGAVEEAGRYRCE